MKNQITMIKESIERAEKETFIIYNCGGVSDNIKYAVINSDNQKAYIVTTEGTKVTACDCPHHTHRKVPCKHMVKIAAEKDLNLF